MADPKIARIEQLKDQGKLEEALAVANQLLMKDPSNKDALIQIADIEYRRGEIGRAEKPIDFLLKWAGKNGKSDAMSHYIKWVLQMEKTNWQQAKTYFKKALTMLKEENPEIMRCYGLCEYWLGHREDGMNYLMRAFEANGNDAEIILNIVEISIMEEQWNKARKFIGMYHKKKDSLNYFDRDQSYYVEKFKLFEQFISWAEE